MMAPGHSQLRTLRFSDFEVDLRTGELHKAGALLRIGGHPLEILIILLEHTGELVTRDELQKRLWPDTFVDVDHNLNTAINKIREVLGDSAEHPRFIETLPRRGYRFIGELEARPPPLIPAAGVKSEGRDLFSWLPLNVAIGLIVILIVSVAALAINEWLRQQNPIGQEAFSPLPFTALPGRAISPAFSPDGSRIAFAWNGDANGGAAGFDLYVKALGSETLLRLTHHPSEWISAAWSPDGTQIAFHRMGAEDTGIYVVPALGGGERKLRSTRIRASDSTPISWSADSKSIAFADVLPSEDDASVNILSMETLESKQISVDPSCISAGLPAFSHNGEWLAYWCLRRPFDSVLYSLQVRGGQPRAIATFRGFPNGLTYSTDDKKLVYSLRPLGGAFSEELGEVTVENRFTKQLDFGRSAWQPTVSPKGDKLAFSSLSTRSSIWRRDLDHPEYPAVELIPSSRAQFDAQYSPDGKRIAFASLRTGLQGVWISNGDGSDLVQISNPKYVSGSPQWSPDGSKIAYDSHPGQVWEIYLADVAQRKPLKLLTDITNVVRPHWSRDGKWIYFSSLESGRMGIFRCPATGGGAVLLGKGAQEINATESFDGKTVYFASNHDHSTLKQIALAPHPGVKSNVEGMPLIRVSELWTLTQSGIYFVPAEAPKSLRYFDLSIKQVTSQFRLDKVFSSGLSVSPAGRRILYSQIDEENADIMLVEHYH